MQTTGTFPQLYTGEKRSRRNSGTFAKRDRGMGGFAVGRAPRRPKNPTTFAGRRAAAHRKVNGA